MNLLVVVFILLILLQGYKGFKRGFTREINGLVSLVMAFVVLAAVFLFIGAILEKSGKVLAISIVLLILISLAYRLLNILLRSVDSVAKLPILNAANRLMGVLAGVLKSVVIFWILYLIIGRFPTGQFGEQIMEWTRGSTILINVYNKNFIAHWMSGLF